MEKTSRVVCVEYKHEHFSLRITLYSFAIFKWIYYISVSRFFVVVDQGTTGEARSSRDVLGKPTPSTSFLVFGVKPIDY